MNLDLPRRAILVVVAFFAVSLALLWFMLAELGDVPAPGGGRTETVRTLLSNADGLTSQDDVMVHGVKVGTVTGVSSQGSGTLVTLSLDASATPRLRRDATVSVGFKTPLGEPFVDLTPGRAAAPLGSDALVSARSTVEIDDALGFLDPRGRANARAILLSLGHGAASPDAALEESDALAALGQASDELTRLTGELGQQQADLRGIVGDGATVLSTLAAQGGQLHGVTVDARTTLDAIAAQRGALGGTLDRLPGVLAATRETLLAVRPLIARAAPVAAELASAASPLTSALRALPATAADAEWVLGSATLLHRDVVPALRRMLALAAPADTAIGELGPTLADLVPVARYLGPRGNTIAAWFANTAALGDHGDAKGDWARFFVMFDPATISGSTSGAPAGNAYTAPGDATHNQPYRSGDFPRLTPYAPALVKR